MSRFMTVSLLCFHTYKQFKYAATSATVRWGLSKSLAALQEDELWFFFHASVTFFFLNITEIYIIQVAPSVFSAFWITNVAVVGNCTAGYRANNK